MLGVGGEDDEEGRIMAKFLANVFVMACAGLLALGNFWYTYGVWPRSWGAFVLFQVLSVVMIVCKLALDKES